MNFNTAIFLVNSHCRALSLAYEAYDENGIDPNTSKPVHTDVFKTLDRTIRKGDLVLGETQSRHKLCVYRVVAEDIEIDLEYSKPIRWVVGKVTHNLEELRRMEDDMQAMIRRKDKEKKRAELAETMMKDYGDELKNLRISHVSGSTLAPPGPPMPPEAPPPSQPPYERSYNSDPKL